MSTRTTCPPRKRQLGREQGACGHTSAISLPRTQGSPLATQATVVGDEGKDPRMVDATVTREGPQCPGEWRDHRPMTAYR